MGRVFARLVRLDSLLILSQVFARPCSLKGLKYQASIGSTHHYFDLKLEWIKISTIKTNFAPCDFVNLFKNRTLKLSCKALNMKSSLFDISILTIASLIVYISCAFLQVKKGGRNNAYKCDCLVLKHWVSLPWWLLHIGST